MKYSTLVKNRMNYGKLKIKQRGVMPIFRKSQIYHVPVEQPIRAIDDFSTEYFEQQEPEADTIIHTCPYCEQPIERNTDPRDHERDCLEVMTEINSCPHWAIRLRGAPREFQIEHIQDCRLINGSKPKFDLPMVPKKDEDFSKVQYRASIIRKGTNSRYKQY